MGTQTTPSSKRRNFSYKDETAITILDWKVYPSTSTLRHSGHGKESHLTPRAMEVLGYFIENPHTVTSTIELLDLFWSKSVRSDHAVHNVIAELRAAMGDKASKPQYIKTYPKRGYALIITPQLEQKTHELTKPAKPAKINFPPAMGRISAYKTAALTLTFILVSVFFVTQLLQDRTLENTTSQRRLTVLPFENINTDQNTLYLSEQLPGSLVSRLTLLPNAQIAISQGKIQNGKKPDYILSGSIQQDGGQHRVQVNLTNVNTDVILFSDQFKFSSEDIFTIQDEIVQHVATALRIYLDDELRSNMLDWGTSSAIAYNSFLRAASYANHSNHNDFRHALDNYQLAINADPNFENAYLGLANTATKMAIYSNDTTNVELQQLVNMALKELIRINPDSAAAQKTQILALRAEGNNQHLIEQKLRKLILAGNPPEYALAHYASLLTSAKLYREAQQLLHLVEDESRFEISPDSTWSYRSKIEQPRNLIAIKKQQLLEKPSHLSILGSLTRSYAFLGETKKASHYLSKQISLDKEGPTVLLNQVIISALYGQSHTAADALEKANRFNPQHNYVFGVKSFILGNIDDGVERWSALDPSQTRRLLSDIDQIEIFFQDSVLQDQRYRDLLENLGIGYSWQRHLMESVMEISQKTGLVSLSEQSQSAYNSGRQILRNNLWNHDQIDYASLHNNLNHALSSKDMQ